MENDTELLPYDPTLPDAEQPVWVPKKYPYGPEGQVGGTGTLTVPVATPTATSLEAARPYDRPVPVDVIDVAGLMAEVCASWPKAKPYVPGDDIGPPQPYDAVYESHAAMCGVVRDPFGYYSSEIQIGRVEGGAWALGAMVSLWVLVVLVRLIWRKVRSIGQAKGLVRGLSQGSVAKEEPGIG